MALSKGQIPDFSDIRRALLSCTKLASSIPSPAELNYQRTLSRPLGKRIDDCSGRLLQLAGRALETVKQEQNMLQQMSLGKRKHQELQEDDLLERFQYSVIETTDWVLEKIDASLDEHRRAIRRSKTIADPNPDSEISGLINGHAHTDDSRISNSFQTRLPSEMVNSAGLAKPQLLFNQKLDNSRSAIFQPLLKEKPHAIIPLDTSATPHLDPITGRERLRIPNPYEREIDEALEQTLPEQQANNRNSSYISTSQIMQSRMEEKSFIYVETIDALEKTLEKLKLSTCVSVDLEHHAHRSFRGFTCLMQVCQSPSPKTIST